MAAPDRLTEEEIERMLLDAMALKVRVESEWAKGKRDGMRLAIFGAASALESLVKAFDAGDVDAVSAALSEFGHARMSLAAHVGVWRRSLKKANGEREGS